jgi:hypothetical protein
LTVECCVGRRLGAWSAHGRRDSYESASESGINGGAAAVAGNSNVSGRSDRRGGTGRCGPDFLDGLNLYRIYGLKLHVLDLTMQASSTELGMQGPSKFCIWDFKFERAHVRILCTRGLGVGLVKN